MKTATPTRLVGFRYSGLKSLRSLQKPRTLEARFTMAFFTTGRALKTALLAEYGHFADKRIKNVDRASTFHVDERESGGLASDGHPFGWFCAVSADVLADDKISVTLEGQIPRGRAVDAWMTRYNAEISRPFHKDQMTFEVARDDVGKLCELAEAFLSIVRPPARYSVPSYKYACPRAAGALERLHKVCAGHWGLPTDC